MAEARGRELEYSLRGFGRHAAGRMIGRPYGLDAFDRGDEIELSARLKEVRRNCTVCAGIGALVAEGDDRIRADGRDHALPAVSEANGAGRFVERVDAVHSRAIDRIGDL